MLFVFIETLYNVSVKHVTVSLSTLYALLNGPRPYHPSRSSNGPAPTLLSLSRTHNTHSLTHTLLVSLSLCLSLPLPTTAATRLWQSDKGLATFPTKFFISLLL